MKRLLTAVFSAIACLVLSSCAHRAAQEGDAGLAKLISSKGVPGENRLSRGKSDDIIIDFMIAEAFEQYDRNGDGFVTLPEFNARGGTTKTFRETDKAGTGKVSLAEAQKSPVLRGKLKSALDAADTPAGGKGYLNLAECIAFRQKAAPYLR